MNCPICGEEDEIGDGNYIKELDISVCDDCAGKIEKHHKVTGKFVVNRCSNCGHVKGVTFEKYQKRGRPAGKKNAPKPEPEDGKQLTLGGMEKKDGNQTHL